GLRREIQHQLRFAPQLMDSGAIHESKSMGIGIASPGGYTDALRSRCDRAIGMAQIPEIERQLRTARGPRVKREKRGTVDLDRGVAADGFFKPCGRKAEPAHLRQGQAMR